MEPVLRRSREKGRPRVGEWVSLGLSTVGLLLFLMGRQPYAAAFTLALLSAKALMLIKWA